MAMNLTIGHCQLSSQPVICQVMREQTDHRWQGLLTTAAVFVSHNRPVKNNALKKEDMNRSVNLTRVLYVSWREIEEMDFGNFFYHFPVQYRVGEYFKFCLQNWVV